MLTVLLCAVSASSLPAVGGTVVDPGGFGASVLSDGSMRRGIPGSSASSSQGGLVRREQHHQTSGGPTLAACMSGQVRGVFQRPLVHWSIEANLLRPLGASIIDVFADLSATSTAEATEARRILSEVLKARDSIVHVDGERTLWQPKCRLTSLNPAFAPSFSRLEAFIRMWQGIEGCYAQIRRAEDINGQQYDWVLRLRPDIMWFAPVTPLINFTTDAVVSAQHIDHSFLSPRAHAEIAFRGVLEGYHKCVGGEFPLNASDSESYMQAILDRHRVPQFTSDFPSVVVRASGDESKARSYCSETAVTGLGEEQCMRLLYSVRPDPRLPLGEFAKGDENCTPLSKPVDMSNSGKKVLIATPLKNAAASLGPFAAELVTLTYPKALLSVVFLVSDSEDGTEDAARDVATSYLAEFAKVEAIVQDFHLDMPMDDRYNFEEQVPRRTVLARSRNMLLQRALSEDIFAVLWLDVDTTGYPKTLVQDLLSVGRPIVAPHVLVGNRTYDKSSWRENKPEEAFAETGGPEVVFEGYVEMAAAPGDRDHMDDFRVLARAMGVHDLHFAVQLDGVGTAALLVEASVHREKNILFPETPYKHRLESEGFGLRARDEGFQPCGLPFYEVYHFDEWTAAANAANPSNITWSSFPLEREIGAAVATALPQSILFAAVLLKCVWLL